MDDDVARIKLSFAEETDNDVEIQKTQPIGKRKGLSRSLPPSKRPKLEQQSKALPTPAEPKSKRGKGPSKLPFSDVRPLISPLI